MIALVLSSGLLKECTLAGVLDELFFFVNAHMSVKGRGGLRTSHRQLSDTLRTRYELLEEIKKGQQVGSPLKHQYRGKCACCNKCTPRKGKGAKMKFRCIPKSCHLDDLPHLSKEDSRLCPPCYSSIELSGSMLFSFIVLTFRNLELFHFQQHWSSSKRAHLDRLWTMGWNLTGISHKYTWQ